MEIYSTDSHMISTLIHRILTVVVEILTRAGMDAGY